MNQPQQRQLLAITEAITFHYWLLVIGYWLLVIGYWLLNFISL